MAAAAPEPVAAAAPPAASVPDAWEQRAKAQVKPLVRALYSAGSFVGRSPTGAWQFSVPNEAHGAKCEAHRNEVEAALSAAVGEAITIELVVGGSPIADEPPARMAPVPEPARAEPAPAAPRPSAVGRAAQAPAAPPDDPDEGAPAANHLPDDDEVDLTELTDAPPESVKTPIDRLAEAFPGSELVNDD